MSSRYLSLLLLLFAILSATQVALIVQQLDKTRVQLSNSSPGGLNFLLQTDSIFDDFQHALSMYIQNHGNHRENHHQITEYKNKFEMVWSAINIFSLKNPGKSAPLPRLRTLLAEANVFLIETDPLVSSEQPLAVNEARQIYDRARLLSGQVHEIGHLYFVLSSKLRDELNSRMDTLYRAFWFFSALLFSTASIATYLLFVANRRSRNLFEKSEQTQAQLSEVVNELRSGKLERKAKDSFIAAASHDLRQPLHALGLFLGSLEKHVLPAGHSTMQKAQQSATVLTNLFSSLLDLSRLDAGVIKVIEKSFQLAPLLQTLEQAFASTALENNMKLIITPGNATIHTDPVLLDRVLRNLIENALIHSNGTFIKVSSRQHKETIRITIEDNGKGIPNNEQHAIFSEYYQIGNPERDRSKGLGLGLSIVKRLSELLELPLELKSSVNRGCTYTLQVPIGIPATNPQPADTEQPVELESSCAKDAVIAVIDDEKDIRDGMEIMLGAQGYATITAESDRDLIELLNDADILPDILITDYRLRENTSGDQAIFNVRKATSTNIPAIIITGDTSPQRVLEASKSGFRLMHKPAAPADLLDAIEQLLQFEQLNFNRQAETAIGAASER
ncbi:hypothetical protein AB833_18610 [Chromatiales bacterium (ex Bugula neritina AB1)]|nr:hypothetical protein AB833_18610 [Chromatiales bacterium (ex Bugula neritina AB1)]